MYKYTNSTITINNNIATIYRDGALYDTVTLNNLSIIKDFSIECMSGTIQIDKLGFYNYSQDLIPTVEIMEQLARINPTYYKFNRETNTVTHLKEQSSRISFLGEFDKVYTITCSNPDITIEEYHANGTLLSANNGTTQIRTNRKGKAFLKISADVNSEYSLFSNEENYSMDNDALQNFSKLISDLAPEYYEYNSENDIITQIQKHNVSMSTDGLLVRLEPNTYYKLECSNKELNGRIQIGNAKKEWKDSMTNGVIYFKTDNITCKVCIISTYEVGNQYKLTLTREENSSAIIL